MRLWITTYGFRTAGGAFSWNDKCLENWTAFCHGDDQDGRVLRGQSHPDTKRQPEVDHEHLKLEVIFAEDLSVAGDFDASGGKVIGLVAVELCLDCCDLV